MVKMKYLRDLAITATSFLLSASPALNKESYLVDITECVAETAKNHFTACIPDLEEFIRQFDGKDPSQKKDYRACGEEMVNHFLATTPQGNLEEETRREIFKDKVHHDFMAVYDFDYNDCISKDEDLNQDNRITIEDWKIYQSLHPPSKYPHPKRRFQKYFIPPGPIVAVR